ncbi:hypothetical protein D9M68_883270 [compost metagenome]
MVVDDITDERDIQSACSKVSRYQQAGTAITEFAQGRIAVSLLHSAMIELVDDAFLP